MDNKNDIENTDDKCDGSQTTQSSTLDNISRKDILESEEGLVIFEESDNKPTEKAENSEIPQDSFGTEFEVKSEEPEGNSSFKFFKTNVKFSPISPTFQKSYVDDKTESLKLAGLNHNTPEDMEATSNEKYDSTVEQIVKTAMEHLKGQNEDKNKMRKHFMWFFIVLLSLQMVAVVWLILLSSIEWLSFEVSDKLLTTFIVSVFVETLGAIVLMITFAFGSKEEVSVVELLIQVVKNYQKYKKNDNGNETKSGKHEDDNKNINIYT